MRIACPSAVTRSHAEVGDLGLHPLLALPLITFHAEDDVHWTARIELRQAVCGSPRDGVERAPGAAKPHFETIVRKRARRRRQVDAAGEERGRRVPRSEGLEMAKQSLEFRRHVVD
jgi:hypothetical protein